MTAHEEIVGQVRALEDRRYLAMTESNIGVLGELFAADLVYTHSDASTDSKQSYLDKLASGHFKYGPISHPETSIIVHGDCVLVIGDMRGEARIGDNLRVLNSASLSVWVRENDSWVLLAFQPTKYPS